MSYSREYHGHFLEKQWKWEIALLFLPLDYNHGGRRAKRKLWHLGLTVPYKDECMGLYIVYKKDALVHNVRKLSSGKASK